MEIIPGEPLHQGLNARE